jgi:uncharacterized membrane protein YraQ (UPF0718 family)
MNVFKITLAIIVTSVLTFLFSYFYFSNEKTYEDCVIKNIKKVQNQEVIREIKDMCKRKYNYEEKIDKEKFNSQMKDIIDLFQNFKEQFENKIR